jgi:hypothetical protein
MVEIEKITGGGYIKRRALKNIKDIIIIYLRRYFYNEENYEHDIPPQLSEDHYTDIRIYDTEPEDLRGFPLIIVNGSNGQMITSGLGDMALEIRDERDGNLLGYKYGGMYNFNLTLEIATRSTLDREVLTDITTKALRFDLRRKIEREGVLVKDMSYNGESTVAYDSNNIYVSTISMNVFSEWYEDVPLTDNTDDVRVNVEVEEEN